MQYLDSILRKIMDDYDEKRARARAEKEKRVSLVCEKFPEIKEIDDEIAKKGIENLRNILNNSENSDKYNKEFEKKLKELKEKKAKILAENGIDPDYDQVRYNCEKCLDTGYEDTKKCSCFIQELIKEHYNMSNMKNILHDFSEFSFDYYGDNVIKNLGISEKENMHIIYDKAVNFCENEDSKSLLFYGGCGFGKTFLSSCIAKRMLDSGKSVIYTSAVSLFSEYEDYKFGKCDIEAYQAKRDMIKEAALLIIDDLGTAAKSQLSSQFLNEIFTERLSKNKRIIISTNQNMKGISQDYTDRIASRIYEKFEILHFVGKDIRIQKLLK